MNTHIEKRPVGQEGLDYLLDCLKYGLTLSKLVLKQIDLENGNLFVNVPEHISMEDSLVFRGGGKFDVVQTWHYPKEGMRVEAITFCTDPIEEEIIRHLNQSPHNICILENYLETPPIFRRFPFWWRKQNLIFFGKEVFLFLQPEHAIIPEKISDTINRSYTMPTFSIFLTSFSHGEAVRLKPYQDISKTLVQQFASNTIKIFSLVYDGESFIIWEK